MIFTGTTVNEDVQPSTNTIIKVLEDMKVVTKYKQQDLFKKKNYWNCTKKQGSLPRCSAEKIKTTW